MDWKEEIKLSRFSYNPIEFIYTHKTSPSTEFSKIAKGKIHINQSKSIHTNQSKSIPYLYTNNKNWKLNSKNQYHLQ